MRRLLAMIATLAGLVCVAAAVEIDVATEPPLSTANLVHNPGIEEAADEGPAGWTLHTATPSNFTVGRAEGKGRGGSAALHLLAHDKVMSGYWAQTVSVVPGEYLFRGWYRTTGGRLLMYAHGSNPDVQPSVGVDARTYHGSSIASFLVPVFIPYEALTGPDPDIYHPFSVRVAVPEGLESVTLSMGMYFTPGEVWFDDIWFGPSEVDLKISVTGEGEQLASVTVLQDGVGKPVYSSDNDPSCPPGRPLAEPFDAIIEGVSAGGSYVITAKTADGELHRVRFPREDE